MAEEGKGVALAILGIVAVIAVVGLVLLFKGATGKVAYTTDGAKVYGGGGIAHGLDEYTDPEGFVRYSTNRVYSGAHFIYPERIEDSGNGVPSPTYDQDYRRQGPVLGNACPFRPYTRIVTRFYAKGQDCVEQGFNPATEDYVDVGVNNAANEVCCI